ncbi:hypothetical protein MHYP_G00113440 [Metynnis hypsauchen]
MNSSKNSKHETRAHTLAMCVATSAAGKLASFANMTTTSSQTAAILEEPAPAPLITADQLSTEFAKQRSSFKEDLSLLIQEAIKPLQVSIESPQTTVSSFQTRLPSVESVAGENFEQLMREERKEKLDEFISQESSLINHSILVCGVELHWIGQKALLIGHCAAAIRLHGGQRFASNDD